MMDWTESAIPYYSIESKEDWNVLTVTIDATLTSKGQTTIPKEIRDSLNMKEGDRMTFTLLPDGTVLMRVKNKSISDLAGRLYKRAARLYRLKDLSR